MDLSTSTTFIAEKIAKIRFCPEQFTDTTTFVSGSTGMRQNTAKFWKIFKNEMDDESDFVPKTLACQEVTGDVCGLEFVDFNNFVVTTADGKLALIYVNRDRDADNLRQSFLISDLHKLPCTGVSVLEEDCVTVGEDGRYNVISCVAQKIVRSNDKADSTGIACCTFVSQKEILTGNNMGVINVFDVTAANEKAIATLTVSCEDEKKFNRVTSIASHPTQAHIILAGTEEGSITVFDLRQTKAAAASYLSAHESSAINEVAFHETEPTKLFTCAENGELWQWTQTTFPNINGLGGSINLGSETPWLDGERAKNNISVTTLLNGGGNSSAINSFDSFKNKIIAAGDNEAVYLIEQLY